MECIKVGLSWGYYSDLSIIFLTFLCSFMECIKVGLSLGVLFGFESPCPIILVYLCNLKPTVSWNSFQLGKHLEWVCVMLLNEFTSVFFWNCWFPRSCLEELDLNFEFLLACLLARGIGFELWILACLLSKWWWACPKRAERRQKVLQEVMCKNPFYE
jgi:hypothetical protein